MAVIIDPLAQRHDAWSNRLCAKFEFCSFGQGSYIRYPDTLLIIHTLERGPKEREVFLTVSNGDAQLSEAILDELAAYYSGEY